MPSLNDAITAVEQGLTAYSTASTQTSNDQAAASALQAKLDGATAQVSTDQQAQAAVAVTLNAALDSLSASALAAKIPAPPVA
jgi:hypothetical protein